MLTDLTRLAPKRFKRYIEPFAGSACLFFRLRPQMAKLGDTNLEVITAYRAIRDDPNQVAGLLHSIPRTKDAYLTLRALDPATLRPAERAARLLFLMKGCFNGVYRTNRDGRFNVPMGTQIYALPSANELVAASRLLHTVELIHGDFASTIDRAGPGDFIYLDPPYPTESRFRGEFGYGSRFEDSDLRRLLALAIDLDRRGAKVMLSFVASPAVESALASWRTYTKITQRSVAAGARFRTAVAEQILTNYSWE